MEQAMRWQNRRFVMGEWLIDEDRGCIERNGLCLPVRFKVMQVLVYLLDHAGRTVSADELLNIVWGPHSTVGKQGITNVIWTLRKLLDDDMELSRIIETIPKRGYRLLLPVQQIE
jgi:DNA-binding winged helix-turn-helix (wHTH) protein